MTTYFTSDPHLGHRKVAAIRGFDSTEAHDEAYAEAWTSRVRSGDVVWILGDLAASSPTYALETLSRLPGRKILVAGNHDACHPMHRDAHRHLRRYLDVFESVSSAARRRIDGTEVLLSHFPYDRDRGEPRYAQWRLPNRGAWLLHGHTHGEERVTIIGPGSIYPHGLREIHVGYDAWRRPVSLDEVADLIRSA